MMCAVPILVQSKTVLLSLFQTFLDVCRTYRLRTISFHGSLAFILLIGLPCTFQSIVNRWRCLQHLSTGSMVVLFLFNGVFFSFLFAFLFFHTNCFCFYFFLLQQRFDKMCFFFLSADLWNRLHWLNGCFNCTLLKSFSFVVSKKYADVGFYNAWFVFIPCFVYLLGCINCLLQMQT